MLWQKYIPKRVAAKNFWAEMERLLAQWQGPLHSECAVEESDDAEIDSGWNSIEVLVFAPRRWTRESHKTFSEKARGEIRLFLLVNQRMGRCKLGRDVLQHLFQFFVWDEPWAPVFRFHRYLVTATHPGWALNEKRTPELVRVVRLCLLF